MQEQESTLGTLDHKPSIETQGQLVWTRGRNQEKNNELTKWHSSDDHYILIREDIVVDNVLSIKILLYSRNVKVLNNKLDMLIYCTLQMHVQQVTYANLLWVLHMNVQHSLSVPSENDRQNYCKE